MNVTIQLTNKVTRREAEAVAAAFLKKCGDQLDDFCPIIFTNEDGDVILDKNEEHGGDER